VIALVFFVFLVVQIGFATIWERTAVPLTGMVLVYVAHNNDFYAPRHMANPEKARRVLASFESLKDRFPGGIAVALITHLEYTGEDVLLSRGWRRERIEAVDRLRSAFPAMAEQAGFAFVDWADIVAEIRAREKTVFAPWSLYVDHAHLAPRGSSPSASTARFRSGVPLEAGPARIAGVIATQGAGPCTETS
jgi:hypothetical protein